MSRVELYLKEFGMTAVQARYQMRQDYMHDQMLHEFRASLAGENQEPYKVETPASWWQHLKQAVFPAWARRRWPVAMTTVTVDVATVYPFLKTRLPLDMVGSRVSVMIASKIAGAFLPEACGLTPQQWITEANLVTFKELFLKADKCPVCKRAWVRW